MFGFFEQKKSFYEISKSIEKFNKNLHKLNRDSSSVSSIMKINDFVIKHFDEPIVRLFLLEKYLPHLLNVKALHLINILFVSLKEINQIDFVRKQILPKLFSKINEIKVLNDFIGNLKNIDLFEFELLKHLPASSAWENIVQIDNLNKLNVELIIFLLVKNLKGFDSKLLSIHYFYKDKTYFYLQNKAQKEMVESNELLESFVNRLKNENFNNFFQSILAYRRINKDFLLNITLSLEKVEQYEKEVLKETCYFSLFIKNVIQQLVSEKSSSNEFYLKELLEANKNFKSDKKYLFMPKQFIFDRIKNSEYFENEVLLNYSFNEMLDNGNFIINIPNGTFDLTSFSHLESNSIIEVLFNLGLLNLINFEKSVPYFMDSSYLDSNLRTYGLPFACYLILFGDEDLKRKVVEKIKTFNYCVSFVKKIEDCHLIKMFSEMLNYKKLSEFPMEKINFDDKNRLSVLGEAIFLHEFIQDQTDLNKLNTNNKDYFLNDFHLLTLEKLMPENTVEDLIEIQQRILNLILEGNMQFLQRFFYNFSFKTCYSYKLMCENQEFKSKVKPEHNFSKLLFIPNKVFSRLLLNFIELDPVDNVFALNFILKIEDRISREDALNILFGFQQVLNNKHDCFAKDKVLILLNTLYLNHKIDFDTYSFLYSKVSLNEEENILPKLLEEIELSFYLNQFVEHSKSDDKMEKWFNYNNYLSKVFNQLEKTHPELNGGYIENINSYLQLIFYHTNFYVNFN